MISMNNKIDYILDKLSNSKFRSSFHLKNADFEHINRIGIDKIKEHCYDFVKNRFEIDRLFHVTQGSIEDSKLA